MDWVRDFYSTTGRWWGNVEAKISGRDLRRAALVREYGESSRILELGCGYGTTAAAMAQAGHIVTAVEISDRADFARRFETFAVMNEDFYAVQLPRHFDVVCYWNGFGIGSDSDQRRLLKKISAEWLRPGGVALIDISNPFVWGQWHGEEVHKPAQSGYEYELYERTEFDPVTCTAIDTWWQASKPEEKISQYLRCYTPADLSLLLAETGLMLDAITVGEQSFAPSHNPTLASLLREHHEYLAVLRH